MKRNDVLAALAPFVLGMPLHFLPVARSQDEVKIDRKHMRELKAKFWIYGSNPRQLVVQEGANLHIKIPAGLPNVSQAGVYSKFVLAGNCEASCTFQLINFPIVRTGYGSMVGMAFDGPVERSWGGIERVFIPKSGNCFVFMTVLPDTDGTMKQQIKIVSTKSISGKIGLKREKNDLIFLAAESPTADLIELHRFPFTDETIRSVRFFGDPGGSPTSLEVRLTDMTISAEEITGGIPKRELNAFPWHWPAIGAATLLGGFLVWHVLRRNAKN